ncbi:MAG: hypothetical protein JSW22_08350 [Chloroflexota bacterium]|nr:MAG: hypothetical protein JSW22_08350 [Chloroflexota bacterium]
MSKNGLAAITVSCLLVSILVVALAPRSSPPVTGPLPPPDEGWIRLEIKDIGSIDYPPDLLELPSGDYREFQEKYYVWYEIPSPFFMLHQVGLNELRLSALREYRRVLFDTDYLGSWETVSRPNEKYTLSQQELADLHGERVNQLRQAYARLKRDGLGSNRIIDTGFVEIAEVNGMFSLLWTYKSQLNNEPVVLVKEYMYQNFDKVHYLTFSYRVQDSDECADVFEKILYSFRLQD